MLGVSEDLCQLAHRQWKESHSLLMTAWILQWLLGNYEEMLIVVPEVQICTIVSYFDLFILHAYCICLWSLMFYTCGKSHQPDPGADGPLYKWLISLVHSLTKLLFSWVHWLNSQFHWSFFDWFHWSIVWFLGPTLEKNGWFHWSIVWQMLIKWLISLDLAWVMTDFIGPTQLLFSLAHFLNNWLISLVHCLTNAE